MELTPTYVPRDLLNAIQLRLDLCSRTETEEARSIYSQPDRTGPLDPHKTSRTSSARAIMTADLMGLDPYKNLAELLAGTISFIDYYSHLMSPPPATLEAAKAALQKSISDLHAHREREQAAD